VTRCEAEGCFIEKLAKSAELDPLRNAEKGVVVVMGKDGKPVALPISLKGFGEALASMEGRNRRASGK
jgi:invasion protein IalB